MAGSGDKAKLHMWEDSHKRLKASVQICLRNNPVFARPKTPVTVQDRAPHFPKRHLDLFWIAGQ